MSAFPIAKVDERFRVSLRSGIDPLSPIQPGTMVEIRPSVDGTITLTPVSIVRRLTEPAAA